MGGGEGIEEPLVDGSNELRYATIAGKSSARCSAGYMHTPQQSNAHQFSSIYTPRKLKTVGGIIEQMMLWKSLRMAYYSPKPPPHSSSPQSRHA